jgi:hypothetical protein
LANGDSPKGRIRFCRLIRTVDLKPLADGAGHTFPPAAERCALAVVLSIEAVPITPVLQKAASGRKGRFLGAGTSPRRSLPSRHDDFRYWEYSLARIFFHDDILR